MGRLTRTVCPGERNKRLSSTSQPPEEGRSVQRPKRWDKHGNKNEDNSPKNVNNIDVVIIIIIISSSSCSSSSHFGIHELNVEFRKIDNTCTITSNRYLFSLNLQNSKIDKTYLLRQEITLLQDLSIEVKLY